MPVERKLLPIRVPLPLLSRIHRLKKEGKIASINAIMLRTLKRVLIELDAEHEPFKPRK